MEYIFDYLTDKGGFRNENQDNACVIRANTDSDCDIVMSMVCDGVGGLSDGALASRSVIKYLEKIFLDNAGKVKNFSDFQKLCERIENGIRTINHKIIEYSKEKQEALGTTLSLLLLYEKKYVLYNVGDSRIYVLRRKKINQLTHDQVCPNTNVLTQCIGVTVNLKPEMMRGTSKKGDVYFMCSDGYYHRLNDLLIVDYLQADIIPDKAAIVHALTQLLSVIRSEGEEDNATAVVLHLM